jgi:hypothetical protein
MSRSTKRRSPSQSCRDRFSPVGTAARGPSDNRSGLPSGGRTSVPARYAVSKGRASGDGASWEIPTFAKARYNRGGSCRQRMRCRGRRHQQGSAAWRVALLWAQSNRAISPPPTLHRSCAPTPRGRPPRGGRSRRPSRHSCLIPRCHPRHTRAARGTEARRRAF